MFKRLIAAAGVVLLAAGSAPAGTIVYNGTGFAIPDNSGFGINAIGVSDPGVLTEVSITMSFSPNHTWVGDLLASLTHNGPGGVQAVELFNRVGRAGSGFGDSSNLAGPYTFIDSATGDFAAAAAVVVDTSTVASGSYRSATNDGTTPNPFTSLNATFAGFDRTGTWTLIISDNGTGDTGSVSSWSLSLTTADVAAVPEPSSLALLGAGTAGLVGWWLRRRRTS